MDSEFIRALETIDGALRNQSTNCSRLRFLGDADKLCDERGRGRRGDGRTDGRTVVRPGEATPLSLSLSGHGPLCVYRCVQSEGII